MTAVRLFLGVVLCCASCVEAGTGGGATDGGVDLVGDGSQQLEADGNVDMPCEYPQQLPPDGGNDPRCPSTYGGYLFTLCTPPDHPCPIPGLSCSYPGQGDGVPGCHATAMMWCRSTGDRDAGADGATWICAN